MGKEKIEEEVITVTLQQITRLGRWLESEDEVNYLMYAEDALKKQLSDAPVLKHDDYVYCPRCDKKLALSYGMQRKVANSQKVKYCSNCGQKLNWEYRIHRT